MLERWWGRFMCPNGIRRTFNPKKWEHGTLVLVFGELLALGAAIAAVPGWTHGKWFLYAAPIIAAGALAWYALDKSSLGEMPLTGVSANRIANVVRLVNTEEKLGPVVQWGTISADGTQVEVNLSNMKPELKVWMAEALLQSQSGDNALAGRLSESDAALIVDAVTPHPVHLKVPEEATDEAQA